MKLRNENLYTKASLLLLLGYFATFMVFYLSNVLFSGSAALAYVWIFLQRATYLLMPLLSALLILIADAYLGMGAALLRLIPIALVKAVYTLPYYYLLLVYDPLYDSIDALFFALVQTVLECVILYVLVLLLFLAMRFILNISTKTGAPKAEVIAEKTVLDFKNPVSFTFMISALLSFLYHLIAEIIDTVSIIKTYQARLLGKEIIYMVFSYAFDVLLLVVYYFALVCVKNLIVKYRVEKEEN